MENNPSVDSPVESQGAASPVVLSLGRRFLRHPITRIFLFYLLFVAIVLSITILLRVCHIKLKDHPDARDMMNLMIAAGCALLAYWVMVRGVDHRPWATAGFNRRSLLPQLSMGFAVGAGFVSVSVGILWMLGIYRVTEVEWAAVLLLAVVQFLGVGIFEEICFRGYLFQTLETRWGSGVALVCTSLFFGFSHTVNPVPGTTTLQHLTGPAFICLEAGLPLGAAYLLTRRWWLSIGFHWAWDLFEGPVFGLHDSGAPPAHALLHSTMTGSFLSTGGPFGPEASWVVLMVGTLLGMVLLAAAIQRGEWRPWPSRVSVPSAGTPGEG